MIKNDLVHPIVSLYPFFRFKPIDPEVLIDKEIFQRVDIFQISFESALSCGKK